MAYQFVTVNIQITALDGNTGALGSLHFQVSDFVLDTTNGSVVVVPPIDLHSDGGFIGNGRSVDFLAMDDPTLSHNWAWILTADVPGLVSFPKRKFTINFANGAQQNFVALAAASTVVT